MLSLAYNLKFTSYFSKCRDGLVELLAGQSGRHLGTDAGLAAGHDRIAHMGGGMGGWKQAGLPHIQVDMGTGAPKRVNG